METKIFRNLFHASWNICCYIGIFDEVNSEKKQNYLYLLTLYKSLCICYLESHCDIISTQIDYLIDYIMLWYDTLKPSSLYTNNVIHDKAKGNPTAAVKCHLPPVRYIWYITAFTSGNWLVYLLATFCRLRNNVCLFLK